MARRSVVGQLNMFDFFSNLDDVPMGEVEMVSLVPDYAEPDELQECEINSAPEEMKPLGNDDSVVMSRSYERDGEKIEVAYLNYNKVRIQIGANVEIKCFESSKEAVDFYVQHMQGIENEGI